MASNPQPRLSRAAQILLDAAMGYQAALDALNPDHVVNDQYFEEQAEAQVQALTKAGFLIASNEQTTAAVSAQLQRDFRLRIGPNTRRHITDGQTSIPLSLRECDDVAQAAVAALRKVTS